MSSQKRQHARGKQVVLLSLILGAAIFGAPQAHALTIGKAGVTAHCGKGDPAGCNWCYHGQGGCFMVQGCKGNKCSIVQVGAARVPGSSQQSGTKHPPTNTTVYSQTNSSGQQNVGSHSGGGTGGGHK